MSRSREVALPVSPELDGYLDKLKSKPSILGSWNRRYFIIKNGCVQYHLNKSKADSGLTPSGSIRLEDLKSVNKFDATTFQITYLVEGKKDGVYHLKADSQALLTCWVDGLNAYIKARQVFYIEYL